MDRYHFFPKQVVYISILKDTDTDTKTEYLLKPALKAVDALEGLIPDNGIIIPINYYLLQTIMNSVYSLANYTHKSIFKTR